MGQPLIVTADQARAFILGRHGLTTRLPTPERVVRDLVAVQTQYAMSLPVAVVARCKVPTGWEEAALNKRRELVKMWSLRSTLHVHAAEDHALMLGAMGPDKYARFLGWMTKSGRYADAQDVARVENDICEVLADGPKTRVQVHEAVPEVRGLPGAGWGLDMMGLVYQGRVVLAPCGQGPTRFALSNTWFPNCAAWEGDRAAAYAELFRRYLRAHGPATLADFTYWTGAPVVRTREALEGIRAELTEVEITGMPGKRYILAEDVEALTQTNKPHTLSLLAKFDPIIMGWKDKTLFLPDEYKYSVIRPAGQIEATILSRGKVAGAWRLDRRGKKALLNLQPFRSLTKTEIATIERQAIKLAMPLGLKSIEMGATNG